MAYRAEHEGPHARKAAEPNRWAVLALLGTAQLMVVLDATIVNIALPSAQRALHFSTADCFCGAISTGRSACAESWCETLPKTALAIRPRPR